MLHSKPSRDWILERSSGLVDPRLLPAAKAFYESLDGVPSVTSVTIEQLREAWSQPVPRLPAHLLTSQVWDRKVPKGAHGAQADIPLTIYEPIGPGSPRPLLVHFHAGGWVGDYFGDENAAAYSSIIGAVVVAVKFRLAPENPFPAAIKDCYAATLWAADRAEELNADADKLAVIGDSAGGNLAAVVALKAKHMGMHNLIRAQVLVSPLIDLANLNRPSYVEFCDDAFAPKVVMEWFIDHWLKHVRNRAAPYASPIYASDLSGLPAAFILSAEVDVVRDEAEAYADKLSKAGVNVICTRYLGHFHMSMVNIPLIGQEAEKVIREIGAFLQASWL